jgi:calcineurin-like phosphoesterase
VGTHTHIGTVDTRILPKGTAFVTDIGMVGPQDSIIGNETDNIIEKFLTQTPQKFTVGKGKVIFNSVLVEIDPDGSALNIQRIDIEHANEN